MTGIQKVDPLDPSTPEPETKAPLDSVMGTALGVWPSILLKQVFFFFFTFLACTICWD